MRKLIGRTKKEKSLIKARKMRKVDESPEKAVSVISMCKTQLSRMNTGEGLEKYKEELLHHLYETHFKSKNVLTNSLADMIDQANKEGMNINSFQRNNLEDQLYNNFPPLLILLHCFRHQKDISLIEERLNSIKNTNPDQITTVTRAKESRRNHVAIFTTLLNYIKEDLLQLNQAQCELFNNLLVEEDLLLLSVYEVFLFTGDIDDYIDSLFLIHRSKPTEAGPGDDLTGDTKERQRLILFNFKKKLSSVVYKKLLDMIKRGDKTTLDTYVRIVKKGKEDREEKNENFVKEISEFAMNKIKSIRYPLTILRGHYGPEAQERPAAGLEEGFHCSFEWVCQKTQN